MDNDMEEYTDEEESQYGDEGDEEFVEDGDEYVGGPNLGAGVYNQNILEGIQAKSYTERPKRKRSRKHRNMNNRSAEEEHRNTMGEEDYDEDYDNEGENAQSFKNNSLVWFGAVYVWPLANN